MTVARFLSYAALTAAYLSLFLSSPGVGYAQQQRAYSNSTNRTNETDRAAGNMVDAIFDNNAPISHGGSNSSQIRRTPVPTKRSKLQAKLVRNSNKEDGAPPYALVDRYGGVLRYVEPVDRVDLQPYLGKVVGVKHDTGDILLATQLLLPKLSKTNAPSGVQLTDFQEPILAGEATGEALLEPTPADETDLPTMEGETYSYDGSFEGESMYMGGEGMEFGDGCASCGPLGCDLQGGGGSRIWQPNRVYLRGEFLAWWLDGMNSPPLVTRSDPVDRGILPNPGVEPNDHPSTEILYGGAPNYGGDPILEDTRNGFRIKFGSWIDDERKQAIEGDYVYLGAKEETYTAGGINGNPTISRPFFNLVPFLVDNQDQIVFLPPREAAQEVSSADLDGTVTVTSRSEFQGFGLTLRHNLCRCGCADVCCGDFVGCGGGIECGCGPIGCGSCCGPCGSDRRYVDFLAGVRWYQLNESMQIFEDLEVQREPEIPEEPNGTMSTVLDRFTTSNEFVGAELGFDWGIERNRWSFNLLSKLAVGNNRQKVSIFGETTATFPGEETQTGTGGLLAQISNIGQYEQDSFSVIPELNLNVGYKLTSNLKLMAGYTLIYWTDVVRPGDQIDREINPTLLPVFGGGAVYDPVIPPYRPQFVFNETNLLIQGINLGGEYSW